MQGKYRLSLLLAQGIILISLSAAAENRAPLATSGAWSPKARPGEKPTRYEGSILSYDPIAPSENEGQGFHLRMRTAEGKEVRVHLGPYWMESKDDFYLTQGQPIVVVGLKIQLDKGTEVLATEVSQKERRAILERSKNQK